MTPKLKKIIIIGLIAIVAMAVLGVLLNLWTIRKMDKVSLGLARPYFPYTDYTESELAKMYPQIKYADVATRTTPEETYAKFRQALKDNDLEMAIEQLSKESGKRYKENKEALESFFDEGKFKDLYLHYSDEINKISMYESIAQYDYDYYSEEYKQQLVGSINFIKDANGDWKLDSL
ncbi:MAG: hypothetical protein PHQ42_03315 [Patescibacteria group bacterium]|nr:hypothetical protein [Patescibacteria group bacterium]